MQSVDPSLFINISLLSLRYSHGNETDFAQKNICIVSQSGSYSSVACINITFIGVNDDKPVLNLLTCKYTPKLLNYDLYTHT